MGPYKKWSLKRAKTIFGQNFDSLAYGNCRELSHVFKCFPCIQMKSQFQEKIWHFPLRKLSLTPSRNVIMLQHLIIQFLLFFFFVTLFICNQYIKNKILIIQEFMVTTHLLTLLVLSVKWLLMGGYEQALKVAGSPTRGHLQQVPNLYSQTSYKWPPKISSLL